jgi:hypothetical protein
MSRLDELFPERGDCFFALFQDAVYEHDSSFQYTIKEGQFVRRNRVALANKIGEMADLVYNDWLLITNPSFSRCSPHIDYVALIAALTRYSRDIYGYRRVLAKIRDIEKRVAASAPGATEGFEQIVTESAVFGFKVPSESPYIERHASFLLYWISVLKPFHIDFKPGGSRPPEDYIQSYFNEYLAYFMVCVALHAQSVDLTIHKRKEVFKEFLNQLHFRNLSRSSLDFFLPYCK